MKVQITPGAKCVLLRSKIEGNVLKLPPEQLPRDLYVEVNKVLDAGGGKWNRSQKGHVFPSEDRLRDLALQWQDGDEVVHVKKKTQAFYTPTELADELIHFAGVGSGHTVLEPSAGEGAIVERLVHFGCNVVAVEIDKVSASTLEKKFPALPVHNVDFLMLSNLPKFDAVVMNPPFTGGQDIEHVKHAMKFVKPGGVLVSITSPSWTTGTTKKQVEFRQRIEGRSQFRGIEAGAFKASGTNVRTIMVKIEC